jgi:hypothetical protein
VSIVLSFAPLIVFPIASGFYSVQTGLWAALLAAFIVIGLDLHTSGSPKILNVGTVVLFGLLALGGVLLHPVWNELWVRLTINAGFLAIVLFTVATRRPFTLQYAREETPKEFWNAPTFVATNYTITWVWAGAFAWSVAIDLVRIFVPAVPAWLDSTLGIAALVAAGVFTGWYPKQVRARAHPAS